MRRSKGILIYALLLSLSVSVAEAATYYVATTGDDSNPGTLASPWRTIQKAANTAVAGDIVNVRAGTYAEHVALIHSGTSAAPITFQAFTGELPILDGAGLGTGYGFQANGTCNLIIDGFEVRNYNSGGGIGGNIYIHDCADNTSSTKIRNNHSHHFTGVDNPTGIWFHGDRGTYEVYNNILHDNTGSAAPENNNCLVIFEDTIGTGIFNINVHNNECYNEASGLKFKHAAPAGATVSAIFEKNLIHDLNGGGSDSSGCVSTEQPGTIIRNNICYNFSNHVGSIRAGQVGGSGQCVGCQVYNNSFYNVVGMMVNTSGSSAMIVRDNIIWTSSTALLLCDRTGLTSNFNLYNGQASNAAEIDYCGGSLFSFAQWKATGFEARGLTGNPLFVNPTGLRPDFHLQVGSPARGVGTGGLDIGAYPTGTEVVGPTSGGGGDTTPPVPPSNLRVI